MNMFTFSHTIVASTGTYTGTGIARSPKAARKAAVNEAWAKLYKGDAAANYCSGIALEWLTVRRGSQVIFHGEVD